MTKPTGPIDWANQQQADREQASARKLLDQMSDAELAELYADRDANHRRALAYGKAWQDAEQRAKQAEAALGQIGQLHTTELSNEFGAAECRTCRDPWPCDTAQILAALHAQEPTS